MTRAALRVGGLLAVAAVVVAAAVRGTAGALTALGGVGLVVGSFAVTGWSLAWAARHGPGSLQAVALGGFLLRLVVYALAIVALSPVRAVDGPVLAVTVAVAAVVLLSAEVRLLLRRGELWWVQAGTPGKEGA